MTLMLHEHSELLLMVVNSIKKDLEENNEYNNCLALHAIANVGSNEMAETLGPSVHRLLISPYVHQTIFCILTELAAVPPPTL